VSSISAACCSHRCKSRQFVGVRRMFCLNFPKFVRNFFAANFPLQIICSSWLLTDSHKLKHEVTRNNLLILFTVNFLCVFYDILYFFWDWDSCSFESDWFIHSITKSVISKIFLKIVETSVPEFLTNQNFSGCPCTSSSYTTGCSACLLSTLCRYKSLFEIPKVLFTVQFVWNEGPFFDTLLKFCELMI